MNGMVGCRMKDSVGREGFSEGFRRYHSGRERRGRGLKEAERKLGGRDIWNESNAEAARHANQPNLKNTLYNGLSRTIKYQFGRSTTHDAALASSVMESSSSLVNVSSRTVSRTRFLGDVAVAPSATLAVRLCYPPSA